MVFIGYKYRLIDFYFIKVIGIDDKRDDKDGRNLNNKSKNGNPFIGINLFCYVF